MRRLLPALALLVTLSACTSSRPTVSTEPAAVPPSAAELPAAEAPADGAPAPVPELEEVPVDWYRLDAETDRVRGVSVERAYTTFLADRTPRDTVVVAVIDSGVDIEHDDLDDVIWTNEDEVAGNGVDDDGNGYVDDRHGWNFIGGPDGRNVDQDTYEITREYVRLRDRFEDVDAETLSDAEREEYAYYEELAASYQARVREMRGILQEGEQALAVVAQAQAILKEHLGTNTLSIESVRAIASPSQQVGRAREVLLYLDDLGASPEALEAQVDYARTALDYGYNLDFDPRPVVGDDPADLSERGYGNPDVVGPDAEHGTHVAGIIAAERDNGLGIDGIANAVRIMVLRAVPNGDERDKDIANAIRYAVDNGAAIVNMSFGKSYSPQEAVVEEAIRYADEAGVLLVHAAGNDDDDIDVADNFPNAGFLGGGRADNWITVGASSWGGPENFVGSFSNYGQREVDVFAPGVDILSTVPGGDYRATSGTSMAAPVVSGVAALVKSYFPELTAEQLRAVLLDSVVPYAGTVVTAPGGGEEVDFAQLSVTGGIVNALRALQRAAEMTN